MPFLSVIIPIYKVEKYLNQCVDSVLKQNLSECEIILVDDGSPDNSGKICDEYANKFDFIKVIHKENGGLSSARNTGLEVAQGEYIIFMDSDDFWNEKVSVSKMLDFVKANPKTDMFIFSSLDYIEGEGYYRRKEHELLGSVPTDTVRNCYSTLLKNGNIEVSACTKILKKEFVIKNSLTFRSGIVSEDSEWILRVLRKLTEVKIINEPLYLCRLKREGSITQTVGKKNLVDMLNIVKDSIEYNKNNQSDVKDLELCYSAYLWFCTLGLSAKLDKKDKNEIKLKLKETSCVCKYSNSKKTKIANFVYRIFGLSVTSFILKKYLNMKNTKNINKRKYNA